MKLEELLWGRLDDRYRPGKSVLVLTRVSGLFAPSEGRILVFLRRLSPDSKVFYNQGKFGIESVNGPKKLEVIRRLIEIESIPDPDRRERSLRIFALRNLQDSNSWAHWNAAQEFAFLVEKREKSLSTEERKQLAHVCFSTPDRKLSQYLNQILHKEAGTRNSSIPTRFPSSRELVSRREFEPGPSPGPRPDRSEESGPGEGPEPSIEDRIAKLHELASRTEISVNTRLLDALRDPDPRLRGTAAFLLGDRGEVGLKALLVTLLHDDSVSVRRSAIGALGRIANPLSEEALLAALEDSAVNRAAAAALVALGTPRALATIRSRRSALPANHPDRRYLDDLLTLRQATQR